MWCAELPGVLARCAGAVPALRAAPQQPRRGVRAHAARHPPAALPAAAVAAPVGRLPGPPGAVLSAAAVEGRVAPPRPEGRERQPLRILRSGCLAAAVSLWALVPVEGAGRRSLPGRRMAAVAAVAVSTGRCVLPSLMADGSALLCVPLDFLLQPPPPADVSRLQAQLQQDAVEEGVILWLEMA